MELALGAMASMAAGAGTAAGTAAAAGAGLSAFLGSSPVLSILGGAATAVSVLQQMQAGDMQAQQYEVQAMGARNEAIGEQAAGASRSAKLRAELMRTLGENDVAFAASGIDISAGEAATRASRTRDTAWGEISIDRASTDARVAGLRGREVAFRQMASGTRRGALLQAVGTGLQGAARVSLRGTA